MTSTAILATVGALKLCTRIPTLSKTVIHFMPPRRNRMDPHELAASEWKNHLDTIHPGDIEVSGSAQAKFQPTVLQLAKCERYQIQSDVVEKTPDKLWKPHTLLVSVHGV